eukprot:14392134-Heterocapsa_arctica.AAC.1
MQTPLKPRQASAAVGCDAKGTRQVIWVRCKWHSSGHPEDLSGGFQRRILAADFSGGFLADDF